MNNFSTTAIHFKKNDACIWQDIMLFGYFIFVLAVSIGQNMYFVRSLPRTQQFLYISPHPCIDKPFEISHGYTTNQNNSQPGNKAHFQMFHHMHDLELSTVSWTNRGFFIKPPL